MAAGIYTELSDTISLCSNLECHNVSEDWFSDVDGVIAQCLLCQECMPWEDWAVKRIEQRSLQSDIEAQACLLSGGALDQFDDHRGGDDHDPLDELSRDTRILNLGGYDGRRGGDQNASTVCPDANTVQETPCGTDEIAVEGIHQIISAAPCPKCGSAKEPVDSDEALTVWYCKNCKDCSGIDDTFSAADAIALATDLADSLDSGTLRIDPCTGCGNDDPYQFTMDEDVDSLVLKCDICRCPYGEPMHLTEQTEEVDPAGVLCSCGNKVHELVQVHVNENGCINRVICLNCEKVLTIDELPETQERPSRKSKLKPSTARTRVWSLSVLRPGDHVEWDRMLGYWHHAIVLAVDLKHQTLDAIHYGTYGKPTSTKGMVSEETMKINFSKEKMFRVDYDDCSPIDETLCRALSRVGEHTYNAFVNNCEHFARWCKTGISVSAQVNNLKNFMRTNAVGAATSMGNNLVKFLQFMASNEAGSTMTESLRRFQAKSGGGASFVGLMVLGDVIRTVGDISKLRDEMQNGEIERSEFLRCTIKRALRGAGGVTGRVIGGYLGSVVPVVGTIIGSTLGSIIGEWLGLILGRAVAK